MKTQIKNALTIFLLAAIFNGVGYLFLSNEKIRKELKPTTLDRMEALWYGMRPDTLIGVIVKEGDTYCDIFRKHSNFLEKYPEYSKYIDEIAVRMFYKCNPGENPYLLRPGDTVYVPVYKKYKK